MWSTFCPPVVDNILGMWFCQRNFLSRYLILEWIFFIFFYDPFVFFFNTKMGVVHLICNTIVLKGKTQGIIPSFFSVIIIVKNSQILVFLWAFLLRSL